MSLLDDVDLDEPDDILPPRRPQQDPPVNSKKRDQQQTADAATPPPPIENRERPAKRSPLARGTVALGGTAVAGTLLAVVGAAAGPLGLIATAAGTILVPLAWFSAKARKGGSRRGGRQRGGGRQRRGGLWSPGGLGGGGRHAGGSRGGGLLGGGGRSSGLGGSGRRAGTGAGSRAGGARSGGLPGAGGSRRKAGGGVGGLGGASGRRRAGAGMPKLGGAGGRRRAGTGANWGGGRGRGGVSGGAGGRVRGGRGLLGGRGGVHGVSGGRVRTPRVGSNAGPRAGGLPSRGMRGIGRAFRGFGRGTVRGMRAANTGGFNMGSAAVRGARKPTGRRAFTKAYQQYGKKRQPKTATGFAGRVLGGAFAGLSAGSARFLTNNARKLWRSLRAAYAVPTPAQPAQPAMPVQGQAAYTRPASKQHPVPQPAFSKPAQPSAPANPGPGAPTPVPAGAGGGTTSGGSTAMSALFPPYSPAVDFHAACCKFQPIGANGQPSIWPLHDALPALKESVYAFTNGYSKIVANCEQTLEGGLHPAMRSAMAEVWAAMVVASRKVEELEPVFTRAYADAITRSQTRGRAAENV
jgi:hypothetical protein